MARSTLAAGLVESAHKRGVGLGCRSGWEPRPTLSPSQLGSGDDCLRAYALGYLLGIRDSRTVGAPVGLAAHWLLEQYHAGWGLKALALDLPDGSDGERDLRLELDLLEDDKLARDCARAILPHTPKPGDNVLSEVPLALDTTQWILRDAIDWEPKCSIDLVDIGPALDGSGPPVVYDYKTTAGNKKKRDRWCYAMTPGQLVADAQFNIYCAAVWQMLNREIGYLGPVRGSWIYASKQEPVIARKVTAIWKPGGNVYLTKWLSFAVELRGYKFNVPYGERGYTQQVRRPKTTVDFRSFPLPTVPDDAERQDIPCNKYGGCPYRTLNGGPCAGIEEKKGKP